MRLASVGLAGAMLLVVATTVQSQIPVTDAGNAALNTITSFQSTITAIEAVLQTGYQFTELLPLDEITLGAEFAETLAGIEDIIGEGAALIQDAQRADAQVRALFGLENIPRTPLALQLRVNEVSALIFEARAYATRVQTLIQTLGSAVGHLTSLIRKIGDLAGNHASNQTIIQQLSLVNQTLATSTAAHLAAQRTDTLQQLAREMVVESLNRMEAESWASWPTSRFGGPP